MATAQPGDALRGQCWDNSVLAFGTARIFEKRAASLKRRQQVLTFLGIAVPAAVGATYMAFQTVKAFFPLLVSVASILLIIQLVGSIWTLAMDWSGIQQYALESAPDNYHIANRYKRLGEDPPADLEEFRREFGLVKRDDDARSARDNRSSLTDKERRYGMHAALFQFGRKCAGCEEVPKSMNSTDCGICGKF